MPEKYHRLLLIFIHGFKGDDHTFKDFPVRLQNAVTESVKNVDAEQIIYPRYETRGNLKQAVEMFCLWLEGIVEEREKELKGIGDVWVCLICHSMGGILAADTILKYTNQTEIRPPKIIGLLAFDTPFYGVDNEVFTKTAFERADKVKQNISGSYSLLSSAAGGFLATSQKVTAKPVESSSSGWGKWGLAAGVLAGAAAVAYYHKDKVSQGAEYLGSHCEFVGVLFNPTELRERVQNLVKVKNLVFHCYYTEILPKGEHNKTRTFISLPPSDMMSYFSAITSKNDDEIDAHISIFNPKQTTGLDNVALKRLIEIVENYETIVN